MSAPVLLALCAFAVSPAEVCLGESELGRRLDRLESALTSPGVGQDILDAFERREFGSDASDLHLRRLVDDALASRWGALRPEPIALLQLEPAKVVCLQVRQARILERWAELEESAPRLCRFPNPSVAREDRYRQLARDRLTSAIELAVATETVTSCRWMATEMLCRAQHGLHCPDRQQRRLVVAEPTSSAWTFTTERSARGPDSARAPQASNLRVTPAIAPFFFTEPP